MAAPPISIKLRCTSWKQLAAIYERDLKRSAVFLKSAAPPPIGTRMRINLTLPTQTLIVLNGSVDQHFGPGEFGGRGPGVDITLHNVPQSAMWLIESALDSARRKNAQASEARDTSSSGDVDMAAGEKLVEAEDDLVAALTQELTSLRKLNPFQVLGVGYETNDDEVRAAFGSLTKRYHPDRFARYESGEARRTASEIFILIRNAYQRLDSAAKRAKTVEFLNKNRASRGGPPRPAPKPANPVSAAPAPAKPKPAATPPSPATATTPAQPAPAAAPTSSSPQDDTTRAYALLDGGQVDEAANLFRRVTARNPGDRAARIGIELVEGLRALVERDRLEAAQRFEAVLEIDPNNERAARELAEMRRQATNERKNLLTRLLSHKE
jgi:cell division septation protein DedD